MYILFFFWSIKSEEKTHSKVTPDEDISRIGEYTLEDPSDPLEHLYTSVFAHQDTSKRFVSLLFRKLPPKSQFPDYYEVIQDPIDLKDIAKKLKVYLYFSYQYPIFVLFFIISLQ